MSVRKYEKNGDTLYEAYISKTSKVNKKIRVQKYSSGHKSKSVALREEKRLIEVVSREIALLEGKGQNWDFVINKWKFEAENGNLGEYANETIIDHVGALRKWTAPWLERPACELNKADGRDMIKRLEEAGCSVSWQKKVKNTVNVVYNFGIEEGIIKGVHTSPVNGLKLNSKREKVPDILTMEQARFLLSEAKRQNNPWYYIWAVALFTGMRSGELYALRWESVFSRVNSKTVSGDVEKLIVSCTYNKRSNSIKEYPKAGYWRTVPISPQLRGILEELYQMPGESEFVLPRLWQWKNGLQAKALRMFCESIGLPSIKFHALRACFATLMLSIGVPHVTVMKICGWKDLDTMARYIRLAGLDEKGATDKLNLLSTAPVTKGDAVENVVNLFT